MNNTEWFDYMCSLLTRNAKPSVKSLTEILGTKNSNLKDTLIPFDKRFNGISIISNNEVGQSIKYLSFWGEGFKLNVGDVIKRFPEFRLQSNIYDGGTQIFFHPIPDKYEFTAIDLSTEKEHDEIGSLDELEVNILKFKFGHKLHLLRDGYTMTD